MRVIFGSALIWISSGFKQVWGEISTCEYKHRYLNFVQRLFRWRISTALLRLPGGVVGSSNISMARNISACCGVGFRPTHTTTSLGGKLLFISCGNWDHLAKISDLLSSAINASDALLLAAPFGKSQTMTPHQFKPVGSANLGERLKGSFVPTLIRFQLA